MKKYSSVSKLLRLVLVIGIVSCTSTAENTSRVEMLPYYREATFTPHWFESNSEVPADFHRIPSFDLLNQNGQQITNETFTNKFYVADFFFTTCPGICPKMTANMTVLQEAFLEVEEVLLLSHSVTPEYDSIPVLREYATEKGVIDSKWHLVTGERDHIYDLGRNNYFVEEDLGIQKDIDDFLHTENFILVDKDRYIRGIYNGLNTSSINQLIADLKLLIEKS
ncbi:MAG: SCO family protein [Cyclobacteriaceae bacterium]